MLSIFESGVDGGNASEISRLEQTLHDSEMNRSNYD